MQGTVNWFNSQKGYGFLKTEDGKDVFVHHSNIIMDGFRTLDENDIVSFDIGVSNDGREQAVNVIPIISLSIITRELKKKKLYLCELGTKDKQRYMIADETQNLVVDKEMNLLELAAYAGINVEGLE